jgi:hypothetical protein
MKLSLEVPHTPFMGVSLCPPHGRAETGKESDEMTELEIYSAVREQIEHEDNLITQRTTWLVASQSFLFTAFAILVNAPLTSKLPILEIKQEQVFQIIPLVGFAASLLIYTGIIAGILAMGRLRAHWAHVPCEGPCAALPPIQSSIVSRTLGTLTPAVLPPGFMLIWLYLLLSA